jgi:hypothetical protein
MNIQKLAQPVDATASSALQPDRTSEPSLNSSCKRDENGFLPENTRQLRAHTPPDFKHHGD